MKLHPQLRDFLLIGTSPDNQELLPFLLNLGKKEPNLYLKTLQLVSDETLTPVMPLVLVCLLGQASDKFLQSGKNIKNILAILLLFSPQELLELTEFLQSRYFGRGLGSRFQKWIKLVMETWTSDLLQEHLHYYPKTIKTLIKKIHPRFLGKNGEIVKTWFEANGQYLAS